jgi:hypothetical protein
MTTPQPSRPTDSAIRHLADTAAQTNSPTDIASLRAAIVASDPDWPWVGLTVAVGLAIARARDRARDRAADRGRLAGDSCPGVRIEAEHTTEG